MATSERQDKRVEHNITLAQVRVIKWPSRRSYWTLMVGRVTYGCISMDSSGLVFYPDIHVCSLLNLKDERTIREAAKNHIEMLKITKRFLA